MGRLRELLISINAYERLHYVESVAALIIAAQPCFLEPMTRGKLSDLKGRFSMDEAYALDIREEEWRLTDSDGKIIWQIDPGDELTNSILLTQSGGKEA